MLIKDVGGKLSEAEVSAFEKTLGLRLPEDYREFLLENNGGTPSPRGFRFQDARSGSAVQYFFRLRGGEDIERFDYVMETFSERVPAGLLPVARDPFGNLVCVGLVGAQFEGKVVFWDHEGEADVGEPPVLDNLIPVAPTFGEFLRGLYDLE